MFNPLINHEYKFICFWNAKSACGTVKTWFLNLKGVFEWDYSPHSEVSKYTDKITKNQLVEYPYNDYYKFTVVRNPWKRLVSYYKNKKIVMRHKNINFHIDKARPGYSGDITFEELVKFIYDTPDFRREDHVISQYYGLENVKFDKIVKVENFHDDMEQVKKDLNISLNFDFKNQYHQPPSPLSNSKDYVFNKKPLDFNNNDLPSYEYFYNDELKDLVYKSYKNDVEMFNYNF